MSEKIKIAIAENHQLMRQGIISLLSEEDDLYIVFDVGNGAELLEQLKTKKIDIVLLDLDMPIVNGQQALKVINEKHPKTQAIIVSMFYSDEFISECIEIGARGFLPKNSDIENVVDAIRAVHSQGYYFDDKISMKLLHRLISGKNVEPKFQDEILTNKEIEILQLICEGKSSKEIALVLNNSVRTIENHRAKICEKSNSKNTAGLVIYAIKKQYFKIK